MAAQHSVVAERLASVTIVVKRLLRIFSPTNTNTANDIRLEEASGSDTMDQSQLRNRFDPGSQTQATHEGEDSNANTEGELTPWSGDDTSAASDGEDLKESFFKVTLRRLSTGFGSSTSAQEKIDKKKALDESRGYHLFKKHRYEKYPEGFPRLAAWVSSDDDLPMARGFKYLYSRIIIEDQADLTALETKLLEADMHEAEHPAPNFSLRVIREEQNGNTMHRELREDIRRKLKRYKNTVAGFRELQSFGEPTKRNHKAYYDWQWRYPQLADGSEDYLKHVDDLISLKTEQLSFFDNFIETHVRSFPISLFKHWLQPQEERDKTTDNNVTYRSVTRRRILAGGLLVFTAVATLIVPVFLLSLLSLSRAQMTIIASVFILAFAWILYVVEEGKVYRVLLGTATYSAILVVFLNINAVTFVTVPPNVT